MTKKQIIGLIGLGLLSFSIFGCEPQCPDGYKWDSTAKKCRPNFGKTGVRG
jgi:hypothetical protein